ncbi:hypothetical protein V8C40DRAFT_241951 [Trichoderma camerunense]
MTRAASLPLIIPFSFLLLILALCCSLLATIARLVSFRDVTPVATHHLSGDAKALTFEALHFGRSTSFLFLRSGFCASAVACRHAAFYATVLYGPVWITDLLETARQLHIVGDHTSTYSPRCI